MKRYSLIYVDPPWHFPKRLNASTNGLEIGDHYPPLSNAEIIDLPISEISERNAALFLWTTHAHLAISLQALESWGFEYKTVAFEWLKRTPTGKPVCFMGQYTCGGAIELCLLGRRGLLPRLRKDVRKLVDSPRMAHSAKPIEVRDRIVSLYGDLPRIELFARDSAPGWDSTGLDFDGTDIRTFLSGGSL